MNNLRPDPSLKLIETIYQAALDPQGYDIFMGHWEDWMHARVSALGSLRNSDLAMSDPAIAPHFQLALRMIEQIGETPAKRAFRGPQILVDGNAKILWQNAEADRLLGGKRQRNIADLSMSDAHRSALADLLTGIMQDAEMPPILLQVTPAGTDRPVAFRAEPMREKHGGGLAILSTIAPSWPYAADQLLMDTHALTVSECAICALLIQGLPPTEIATRRGTSVATVRTQIKKILRKCKQASHSELTAYLNSLARMAEDLPASANLPELPAPCIGTSHDVTISGRRMIIEEHGPRDGYPIVFLHGMLDGTSVTGAATSELFRLNLRLICPHRPSFGQSEPVSGHPADALKSFAADLRELMTQWGIEAPVMIGHMAGSLYAYEAANPCGACGIVIVSGGVPITSPRQFEDMTRRQRLVAYTARYAPTVLPFVVNAGIRQIKNGGAEAFLSSLYENAPVDRDLLQDDVLRAMILRGHKFTVTQGHAGFVVDSYHVVRDWTETFLRSAPLPVRLLHGKHDPVVSCVSVEEFASKHADRVTLDVVEDSGQLLFYHSPARVLQSVRELADLAMSNQQRAVS